MTIVEALYQLSREGKVVITNKMGEEWHAGLCDILEGFNIDYTVSGTNWKLTYELNREESSRKCNTCLEPMQEGYYVEQGEEVKYFCQAGCLHEQVSEQEYNELFEHGYAYYTEWED